MDLFLVQHGLATSKQQDPDRPLTAQGHAEIERVATVAATLGLGIADIFHSGKLRARQTAALIAQIAVPTARVEAIDGLAPNDDPRVVAKRYSAITTSTLLVGHLPHLDRLVGYLVVRDPDQSVVAFRNGAIVALNGDEGAWRIRWVLSPENITGE